MPRGPGYVTKTHFLKQTNLGSLLEPADPSEADFTATKGTQAQSLGAALGCSICKTTACRLQSPEIACALHRRTIISEHSLPTSVTQSLICQDTDNGNKQLWQRRWFTLTSAFPCSRCYHRAQLSRCRYLVPTFERRSNLCPL